MRVHEGCKLAFALPLVSWITTTNFKLAQMLVRVGESLGELVKVNAVHYSTAAVKRIRVCSSH